jgi:SpoVK/Ycf46/Vps4 family AAA+-type ATPase
MKLLKGVKYSIRDSILDQIVAMTEGYSSADLTAVVKDVAMAPLRDVPSEKILTMKDSELRPVKASDFKKTLKEFQPSVSKKSLKEYEEWHKQNSIA